MRNISLAVLLLAGCTAGNGPDEPATANPAATRPSGAATQSETPPALRKPCATVAELGERFIAAIASEDKMAYRSCWPAPGERVELILSLPDPPKITPEQLQQFKEYEANTHKVVGDAFGTILANLQKAGIDPRTIQYHSVKVKLEKTRGVEVPTQATTVDVYFTSPNKPGKVFYVWIDDALKINGDWRFVDKPRSDIRMKP